jgi:hypothetical protein
LKKIIVMMLAGIFIFPLLSFADDYTEGVEAFLARDFKTAYGLFSKEAKAGNANAMTPSE